MSLDSRIRDNFERRELELPKQETIVGYDAFIPPVKYLKTCPIPYTSENYPLMQQPIYFNPLYLPHHDMVNPLIIAFLPFVLMAYVKKSFSDIFQQR